MELTQPFAEPVELADTPLEDRLAAEARTDPQAFALLYERHLERVYRYLRARGANDDDAAELAALTFERALSHIDRYRPGRSGFVPWLLRIARNAFIDAARRHSSRSVGLDEVAEWVAAGLSPEDRPSLDRPPANLKASASRREIAAVTGKSEAATKKLLTRSLAALKEAMRNDS